MNTRHFCTYFDHRYLPRGMVMLESLHEHCPQAHVHVLCLSEECRSALAALAYPWVSLMSLAELEASDPELLAVRGNRSLVEYYFTITPCLPWHFLTRCEEMTEITYLDADMMFFSSLEPIFEEAGDASVIITPHRFLPRYIRRERFGIYNVSWITFRKTSEGMACLDWYRKACLDWCGDQLLDGRYADQKYLDAFPEKFPGTHVMQHPGGGVAPWNAEGLAIEKQGDTLLAKGVPLIFYHAHGFECLKNSFYSSGFFRYGGMARGSACRHILTAYAERYAQAMKTTAQYIGDAGLSGLRQNKLSFFRLWKRIIREWHRGTLVVCRS